MNTLNPETIHILVGLTGLAVLHALVKNGLSYFNITTRLNRLTNMTNNMTNNTLNFSRNDGIGMDKKGSILFERHSDKTNDIVIIAFTQYMSLLSSSKELVYDMEYFVTNQEEFCVGNDLYCKVINYKKNNKGELERYTFEIYSYTKDIEYIREFIDKIKNDYMIEQTNKLGKQQYYFDEKAITLMKEMGGGYRWDQAPKNLQFDKVAFNTNKSMSNVFGKHLDVVKRRFDMFCNKPEWYQERGIPYTLGIMLHGPPGTGKTSLIKALANDSNRHIINISLRETTTQSQLKSLFFDTNINILTDNKTEVLNIPLNKRIYVIEDIDCLTDIVYERKSKYEARKKKVIRELKERKWREMHQSQNNTTSMMASGPVGMMNDMVGTPLDMLYNDNSRREPTNAEIDSVEITEEEVCEILDDMEEIENNNMDMDMGGMPILNNKKPANKKETKVESSEKLSLSFLLNLLDGVLETPGRILIITTNRPEKLDKALIRPGRIDINIKVGYCDLVMIEDMMKFFYEMPDFKLKNFIYNKKLTPAEVQKILLDNYDNIEMAYDKLVDTCS